MRRLGIACVVPFYLLAWVFGGALAGALAGAVRGVQVALQDIRREWWSGEP